MLRLERDAWSIVTLLRQLTNEYAPPPHPKKKNTGTYVYFTIWSGCEFLILTAPKKRDPFRDGRSLFPLDWSVFMSTRHNLEKLAAEHHAHQPSKPTINKTNHRPTQTANSSTAPSLETPRIPSCAPFHKEDYVEVTTAADFPTTAVAAAAHAVLVLCSGPFRACSRRFHTMSAKITRNEKPTQTTTSSTASTTPALNNAKRAQLHAVTQKGQG